MLKAKYLVAIAAFAGFAMAAVTVDAAMLDVIEKRKAAMKGVGKAAKAAKPLAKNDLEFTAAAAAAQMAIIAKAAEDVAPLFPVGSETGGETAVLPAIWQNKQDFDAKLAKLATDAKAAGAAAGQGHAAFKAAFFALVKNCKGCHDDYKAKKK